MRFRFGYFVKGVVYRCCEMSQMLFIKVSYLGLETTLDRAIVIVYHCLSFF